MSIVHEVKDEVKGFRHRLVNAATGKAGPWAGYSAPAVLQVASDMWYVGVTDAYKYSSDFPNPSKIYKVQEI